MTASAAPHGHNRFLTVLCKAEKLDENGMVANLTQRAIHGHARPCQPK
ncbi:MAG: hypothetical protein ACI35N_07665 [Marinilabiliaceae bacterium]